MWLLAWLAPTQELLQATGDVSFSSSEIAVVALLLGAMGTPITILWRRLTMAMQADLDTKDRRIAQLDAMLSTSSDRNRGLQERLVEMLTTAIQANTATMLTTTAAMEVTADTLRELKETLMVQHQTLMLTLDKSRLP